MIERLFQCPILSRQSNIADPGTLAKFLDTLGGTQVISNLDDLNAYGHFLAVILNGYILRAGCILAGCVD